MADEASVHVLPVPGARLRYEVRGDGPPLLMIGSPMGSRGFAMIAPLLAEEYTVVTYDPRGILNSPLADPTEPADPDLLADDVALIAAELDRGPAYVFGNSGGGVTGLAMLTRHPQTVRALVVHEPPLVELLPDRDAVRAAIDEVCQTYDEAGREAALRKYTALTGIRFGGPAPAAPAAAAAQAPASAPAPAPAPAPASYSPPADVRAILDRFFRYILPPTTRYRPDLDAVRATGTPVIVAGGADSPGQLFHRTALALAEELGTDLLAFPDGHIGFQQQPEPFARLLAKAFAEAR
ncbi:MAG: alpha/beta fold hydrolase [Catenulispora sp.]